MTYEKGMVDAIERFGKFCGSKSNCEGCRINLIKGSEMSCTEFANKFPQKFVSIMLDEVNKGISYIEEYHLRFPECDLDAEDMASLGICRRAMFEGYLDCEKPESLCRDCWEERYHGDKTEEEGEENNENY